MINTYNESDLHAKLKTLYALETNGTQESKLDDTNWICDIITESGNVIEIQTANLSALTEKAEYILGTGRKLTIVHPIAEAKWIELYARNGVLLHRKKSPKKATLFDSLRGMTKICPLFLHKNCTLEVLYCEITELRRETEQPAQTQSKSRRHLKNWLPMGKRLDKITRKERFATQTDWEKLIPAPLRSPAKPNEPNEGGTAPTFRATDLASAIKAERGAKEARWASLLIWIFMKMGILTVTQTRGRSKFYSLTR